MRDLDLGLIVTDSVRLDVERDRARLRATLDQHRPRLLILDPLVRLHRIDENSAGEMSALLGELRALQRRYQLALVSSITCARTAARMASRCAALAICTRGATAISTCVGATGRSSLTVEHRSAPVAAAVHARARRSSPRSHLRVVEGGPDHHDVAVDAADKIVELLSAADTP